MDAQNAPALLAALKNNIGKVIVGREETVELLLTALLCGGHVLLEDVPEEPPGARRARSPLRGWNGRIRRLYARTVTARTGRGAPLQACTPTELERAAAFPPGSAAETLHRLYELARYSADGCGRQEYLAAKEAAQRLRREEAAP